MANTSLVTNRRRVLLGLAAASAAATTPVAAMAPAAPAENPALLNLAKQFAKAIREMKQAKAALSGCCRDWAHQWPDAPEAINATPGGWGEAAETFKGHTERRHVLTSDGLGTDIATVRKAIARKRKHPERPFHVFLNHSGWRAEATRDDWEAELEQLRDLQQIAATYEREKDFVRTASRVREISSRQCAALEAVVGVVSNIMAERPETMEGVVIQAQALDVWKADGWGLMASLEEDWAGTFARNLLRIAAV
ncbi:hypothetical protein [Pelagibacterium luteolum]|uniref:Tat (Twin-arginine translocation) pathway signal sequence n=1 Tax=Pelagibacterium luteolum TaxID=440168 RepID=A0A1G7S9H9_9HYPH|nr:hypothetical protein [Pelagibacterium luteolum]SDG19099.1 hypothetical protein SAMN04487974_101354 [Pelagibacterium luteolum]